MKTMHYISIAVLFLLVGMENCQFGSRKSESEGERLANKYCTSCHLEAAPNLLDSITWTDHVLPAMAPGLGVEVWANHQYYIPYDKKAVSGITIEEWTKLVEYYENTAPKKLKPAKRPVPLKHDRSVFALKIPVNPETSKVAETTMVAIDPNDGNIYSGDAYHRLYQWDRDLQPNLAGQVPSAVTNLYFMKDANAEGIPLAKSRHAIATCIGVMQAVDMKRGQVWDVDLGQPKESSDLFPGEQFFRPVQTCGADFNKDGLQDWVVCSFGHSEGGLYLMQQRHDHQFKKITIDALPGAEQAVTGDFNHDGWPDIMALFAQAREGVWMFLNNQKGGFDSKIILQFSPVYGSTSFQLVDFNHDGKLDVLYTCGDNGDYSKILKPYHGVYIYLNQGNFHFKQAWFYPINGCTKAIAADFDNDGDLDIATIAFFADLKSNPSESFIYFEQDKPLSFIPHAVPINQYGRWICMDVGDYDQDGDLDIVLGNYNRGLIIQDSLKRTWNRRLPLIVLENRGKHDLMVR